jgi:hypothetical protein
VRGEEAIISGSNVAAFKRRQALPPQRVLELQPDTLS